MCISGGGHHLSGQAARHEAKPAGAHQLLLAAAGALLAPLLLLPRDPRRPCWLSGCTHPPGGLHQTCLGSAQAIMLTISLDGRTGPAIAAATSEGSLLAALAVGLFPSPWWCV